MPMATIAGEVRVFKQAESLSETTKNKSIVPIRTKWRIHYSGESLFKEIILTKIIEGSISGQCLVLSHYQLFSVFERLKARIDFTEIDFFQRRGIPLWILKTKEKNFQGEILPFYSK
jgi:hypothetical protein